MKTEALNLRKLKRFAIMGGTFDPIHMGHLVAASNVQSYFNLEKVIFMPTGSPPHKSSHSVSGRKHRYAMTLLATMSNRGFEISTLELERKGASFTVDTISELRKQCGKDTRIHFIIGEDTLGEIPSWKNAQKLFTLCEFIVVSRQGEYTSQTKERIKKINELFGVRPSFLKIPGLTISSTEIRSRIRQGRPVDYLLPRYVEGYIRKHDLYKEYRHNSNEIKEKLEQALSEHRLRHTICVAEEAVTIAGVHGIDIEKAYLAGLLHDCAKELTVSAAAELCKRHNINPGILDRNSQAHGILGALMAADCFNVIDEDILNAIKYHTTAREEMSDIEKVLFIADLVEPCREPCDELDLMRETALKDLNAAVKMGLEMKRSFQHSSGKAVHPLTVTAINYYNTGGNI